MPWRWPAASPTRRRQSAVYVRHEGSTAEEEVPTDQITHICPGDVVRVKTTLFWDAMSCLLAAGRARRHRRGRGPLVQSLPVDARRA